MAEVLEDRKYTKTHEWVKLENDIAVIGITDFAQEQLSDIVYVDLGSGIRPVKQGEIFGTIEAVKAVSDLYAPVSGEIIEINEKLKDLPDLVNKDPYGAAWMIKIKIANRSELDNLLDASKYQNLIGKGIH